MTTIPAPLLISADFWYWPTTAPERAVKALEIQSPTVMVNTGFTDDARTISRLSPVARMLKPRRVPRNHTRAAPASMVMPPARSSL